MQQHFDKSKTTGIVLVLVGAFIVLFWIFGKKIFLLIALILVGLSIIWPGANHAIAKGWMKLGEWMGYIMSKVLLTAVYYILLLPLALMYRFFKKDFLALKRRQDSYYTARDHQYGAKDLENIW